jgi:solute carrier family 13 (sodium-dependent dicarboxylate transporter), member 2/3/5
MERWNLHKRIAFLVLLKLGADIRKSLAGFIALGAFLSMFLSNSTSAMILTPIVTAVSAHLERMGEDGLRVERGFLLAVAFAVGIGGCATPIGSPTNLIFLKVYRQLFPLGPDVTFMTWVSFGFPLAVLCSIALFGLIWFLYLRGFKDNMSEADHAEMHGKELSQLGPMGFAEKVVLVDLVLLMLLWIFRGDFNVSGGKCVHWNGCMPGWSNLFPQPSFIGDGGISVMAAIPLFLVPSRSGDDSRPTVVDWKTCVSHLPWFAL